MAVSGSLSPAIHRHRLVNVAELWVTIAEISDLLLIQAIESVIPLSQIALPVLPLGVADAYDGQKQYAALAHQVDCVTGVILRCVLGDICPCREDTTGGAERNDVGRGNGADRWVTGVVGRPCEESGTAGERADCDQEDASVADVGIRNPAHDGETCNGGDSEDREVQTAAVGLVADESDCDGDQTSADVRRDGVELGLGGGPTKIIEDGGLADS